MRLLDKTEVFNIQMPYLTGNILSSGSGKTIKLLVMVGDEG